MDSRKWPDRRHWQYTMHRLGRDAHGEWLSVPAGTVAQRGDQPPRPLGIGMVVVIPAGTWWTAEFYRDHPFHSVYVNIGTPCEWNAHRVTLVDLDLDVVRTIEGSVAVLDRDEFDEHRVRFEYPRHIVEGALHAVETTVAMLEANLDPFGGAADRWLDLAG